MIEVDPVSLMMFELIKLWKNITLWVLERNQLPESTKDHPFRKYKHMDTSRHTGNMFLGIIFEKKHKKQTVQHKTDKQTNKGFYHQVQYNISLVLLL